MTTTIEPTQEQRDAAHGFASEHASLFFARFARSGPDFVGLIGPRLALFLAEREAKLRADINGAICLLLANGQALHIPSSSSMTDYARAATEAHNHLRAEVKSLRALNASDSEFQQGQQRKVEEIVTALDALTKRNAALLVDKEDLIRQLRRVEEDRDAAHARARKMEAETTQRLAASDGVVWQRVKERDAAVADYRRVEAQLRGLFAFPVVDADGCVAALQKLHAEVAALKAKLAEVEGERNAFMAMAVSPSTPPQTFTSTTGTAPKHLSGAGTEWAAPIAAADEKGGAFAARRLCPVTNCNGDVDMYWRGPGLQRGECSRCKTIVNCGTSEPGPLANEKAGTP